MPDIEKELSGLKVGMDQLLETKTITFTKDNKMAFDVMYDREKKLFGVVNDQADEIKTLKASLAANKESLDQIKAAQDGMIPKDALNNLTAELLDARQVAEKVGLDCKTETDPMIIQQNVIEKMLPEAHKTLTANDSIDDPKSVKAAYVALKENMGFHKKVNDTKNALDNHQTPINFPKNRVPLRSSLENFPRS